MISDSPRDAEPIGRIKWIDADDLVMGDMLSNPLKK